MTTQVNILNLPVAVSLSGAEYFPLVQGGTTRRAAVGLLDSFIFSGGTQSANTVFAGPTTGSSAAPSFRALVPADLPDTQSGGFWADVSPGARIWRLADRVFVGEAVEITGDLTGSQGGLVPTDTEGPGFLFRAGQFISQAATGLIGITGYSRSSDNLTALTCTIGVAGGVINDKASGTAWGLYSDLQHETGATATIGLEVAAKNKSSNVDGNPFNLANGVTGVWLAGGGDNAYGGVSTNPSNAAVVVLKNSNTWNNGILFDALGITGTDGVTGEGKAVSLAKGHTIGWYYAGGNVGFDLVAHVNAGTDYQRLQVDSSGVNFYNNASHSNFRVAKVAGAVTGNLVVSGSTSAFPTLSAEGSGSNASIGLLGQGGGGAIIIRPNGTDTQATFSASGLTLTGFLGIGTAAPVSQVHAVGDVASADVITASFSSTTTNVNADYGGLTVFNDDDTVGNYGSIWFATQGSTGGKIYPAVIQAVFGTRGVGDADSELRFDATGMLYEGLDQALIPWSDFWTRRAHVISRAWGRSRHPQRGAPSHDGAGVPPRRLRHQYSSPRRRCAGYLQLEGRLPHDLRHRATRRHRHCYPAGRAHV